MSSTRTRIKICGITNIEDARAAVDCGADALGFILVPGTPRYIEGFPEGARVPTLVPPFVERVMVCRRLSESLGSTAGRYDVVQFYEMDDCAAFAAPRRFLHAFRIQDESGLAAIGESRSEAQAFLLDAYHPDKLGGSGETFNWDLAREVKARFARPIVLAGGLTPDNVGDAIAAVRPYAVDVSSGVEAEPGRKDHARLRAFIRAVHRADDMLGNR